MGEHFIKLRLNGLSLNWWSSLTFNKNILLVNEIKIIPHLVPVSSCPWSDTRCATPAAQATESIQLIRLQRRVSPATSDDHPCWLSASGGDNGGGVRFNSTPLRNPRPSVNLLFNYLQNVTDTKRNSRLGTRDQLIVQRVVVELSTNENLWTQVEEGHSWVNVASAGQSTLGILDAMQDKNICWWHSLCHSNSRGLGIFVITSLNVSRGRGIS